MLLISGAMVLCAGVEGIRDSLKVQHVLFC